MLVAASVVHPPANADAGDVVQDPCAGSGGEVTIVTSSRWICFLGSGVRSLRSVTDVTYFHPSQRRGWFDLRTSQESSRIYFDDNTDDSGINVGGKGNRMLTITLY